jgi:hypothetical protein
MSMFGDVSNHTDGIPGSGVDSHGMSEYIGLISSLNIEPLLPNTVRDLSHVAT